MKIKVGDNVKVMRGKDAGVTGEVVKIFGTGDKAKAIVEGANKSKLHRKANESMGLPGGIIDVERPIHMSNLMLVVDDKPTRVRFENTDKGKNRIAVKTGKQV